MQSGKSGKTNPNSYAGGRSPYGSAQASKTLPKKAVKKGKTPRNRQG